MNYKLSDRKRRARLKHFADSTTLGNELALARLLAEESANAGNTALASSVLLVVGKLSVAHAAAMQREGQTLEKTELYRLANVLGQVVCEELENKFDGWETVVERIANRVEEVITSAGSPALIAEE